MLNLRYKVQYHDNIYKCTIWCNMTEARINILSLRQTICPIHLSYLSETFLVFANQSSYLANVILYLIDKYFFYNAHVQNDLNPQVNLCFEQIISVLLKEHSRKQITVWTSLKFIFKMLFQLCSLNQINVYCNINALLHFVLTKIIFN